MAASTDDQDSRHGPRRFVGSRPLAGAGILAILVIGAAVVVFALRKPRTPDGNAVGVPERLGTVVTADYNGRVLLLDAVDGSVVRVLATGRSGTGGLGLARSPDGRTVYFVLLRDGPGSEPTEELVQVSEEGAPVRTLVARGREPAVSPDGRRLAYVVPGNGQDVITVRELGTGTETTFPEPKSAAGLPTSGVSDMTWLSDNRRLALSTHDPVAIAESTGAGDTGPPPSRAYIHILDTGAGPGQQLRQVAPELAGGSALWITRGPEQATVAYIDRPDESARSVRMIALSVDEPNERTVLFELPQPVVQAFIDPSGETVLYLHHSKLYRRTADETSQLKSGQQVMAW